ncbi:unnamed protein product [Cuscuta campestris]|uniref:Uncharacterized protein n=1 Tax=Cuscuta campestris TaxID=132261 RepID=A0A484LER3_9ASTE|nr:unnamed protein product [Cuscuta campestris]
MADLLPHSHALTFCGVLSESRRIINAHSRHFLALSVFFLLPLSFSLIIYPTLHSALCRPDSISFYASRFLQSDPPRTRPDPDGDSPVFFILPLVYALFGFLVHLFAVTAISYSTFHGFYGRPVKLVSSFKSLLFSFLPMISTFLVSKLVLFSIAFLFSLLWLSALKGLELAGIEVDYDSNYFYAVAIVSAALVGAVMLWLQVTWVLAPVTVVVESRWGFGPLMRSANLVKGMKGVALSLLLFFNLAIWFLVGSCATILLHVGVARGSWGWAVILQVVISAGLATVLMLQGIAATVVLFMYCKAFHGELPFEIAEEFAGDYVSLPFDEKKLPYVVYVT